MRSRSLTTLQLTSRGHSFTGEHLNTGESSNTRTPALSTRYDARERTRWKQSPKRSSPNVIQQTQMILHFGTKIIRQERPHCVGRNDESCSRWSLPGLHRQVIRNITQYGYLLTILTSTRTWHLTHEQKVETCNLEKALVFTSVLLLTVLFGMSFQHR